jgi:prophage regulatory protein
VNGSTLRHRGTNVPASLTRVKRWPWDGHLIVSSQLVSRVEIADMLGVSKQRVHQLIQREDFPAPLAQLGIGDVWEREAVETWIRTSGRGADDEPL